MERIALDKDRKPRELISDLAEAEEDIKNKRVFSNEKVKEMLGKRSKR
jgi:hypothetical protein